MDVLLMPDQMMLQIHESIGHPLELDRILGDERNFAGTSFVTLDMFGHYAYGSELLNVTYDPTRPEQIASFGFDDEGEPAQRRHLIEHGILKRPLGGAVSLARARALRPDLEGVATARASGWNRAPIDRMSNLNIEPGTSTLDADDRQHRARRDDAHQRLVEHRRLAQQVPVRLRVGPHDPRRPARRGGARPELPRHQRDLLALAGDGRRRRAPSR